MSSQVFPNKTLQYMRNILAQGPTHRMYAWAMGILDAALNFPKTGPLYYADQAKYNEGYDLRTKEIYEETQPNRPGYRVNENIIPTEENIIEYKQMGRFWIVRRRVKIKDNLERQYLTREGHWEKINLKTAKFCSREEAEKAVKEAPEY